MNLAPSEAAEALWITMVLDLRWFRNSSNTVLQGRLRFAATNRITSMTHRQTHQIQTVD